MRGFLQPAIRHLPSDNQTQFTKLSRHRRASLAKAAQTTLIKAEQWARGDGATPAIASALDAQIKALLSKRKG